MDIQCPKCDELVMFDLCNELGVEKGVKNTQCVKCSAQLNIEWCLTFQIKAIEPIEDQMSVEIQESKMEGQSEIKKKTEGIQYGTVLVAVEALEERNFIKATLNKGGFSVRDVSNGSEALEILKKEIPGVLLIDVGLPQIFGFELCEIIKKSPLLHGVKVVLLASIYKESPYKRNPENLYGADDYIEHPDIEKDLVLKINRLIQNGNRTPKKIVDPIPQLFKKESIKENEGVPGGIPLDNPVNKPIEHEENSQGDLIKEAAPLSNRSTPEIENGQVKPTSPEYEAAQRLARIIISDITLYNKQKIEDGLQKGDLLGVLKSELEEGRNLYRERVSEEILNSSNYLDEALREYIQKRKSVLQ